MTEAERIARANRAQAALDEFLAPILDEVEQTYLKRLREVSTTDYGLKSRSDKQTALSFALSVVDAVRSGMSEVILDGKVARDSQLRAERMETMTDPQKRLLGLTPY